MADMKGLSVRIVLAGFLRPDFMDKASSKDILRDLSKDKIAWLEENRIRHKTFITSFKQEMFGGFLVSKMELAAHMTPEDAVWFKLTWGND